jgi:threonine dehydrogenase-like Zn-dependent dehydrogenase
MKAIAVFPAAKAVRLIDHPEPSLRSATDVKIAMINVGVCGTDREIWNFEYGTPPEGSEYLITGHESFGRVIEAGRGVTAVKVGDLVVPTVRRGCPENCLSCANGQPDFCFTGHFTERGIKGAHGYMSEFVVEDERYLNRVPPELADVGVLLEPLTITEKALLQIYLIQSRLHWECRIEKGATDKSCRNAVVLGAGPVGLLAALAFRLSNMKTVVVARSTDPKEKEHFLKKIGAEYASTKMESPAQLAGRLGNIDLILEATGAAQASFDFLSVLGTNGIFIFTGVPGLGKNISLDGGTLMRNIVLKNQVVLGTVNAPKIAFENGIRDLAAFKKQWPGQVNALITGRFRPEQVDEVVGGRQPDEIKSVFEFSRS